MKANLGPTDRIIRLLAAAVIIALYFMHRISGTTAIVLLVVAGLLVLTSLISFCPLYFPFKIKTTRK